MMAQTATPPERRSSGYLLGILDVERETSLSRATIYRRIAAGAFPGPIRPSPGRVAWRSADIDAWKAALPA